MAGLKIEGDLTLVSDRQLEYIRSVIEQRGYKENKVIFTPLGKAGDNYVANVKRITVEDDKGAFKMVAKVAPHIETQRQMTNTEALFRNEHIMYTKILPKFTQLEKSYDVPQQDRLRYAICYGSLNESPNEVIILEDLNESSFVMLNRMRPLPVDCVKSVLRNFALLHSLSYALKYKEPKVFEECKNSLFDMWSSINEMEEAMAYFEQTETSAINILDSDIHKKMIRGSISGSLNALVKFSKSDRHSKYLVIQQGDAWTNNIMFKFDNETVLESVMIDYQISKPANPVVDLLYMIFNCTDHNSRKEHFHEWIDYYHTELDKALSNYGLKASFVYPKDQLDVDLKRYAKSIFGQVIITNGVIILKPDDAAAMKAAMESADMNEFVKNTGAESRDPETTALFKNRIEGLVDSFVQLGFL